MASLSYRRHRFPPEIIQHAIWGFISASRLRYRDRRSGVLGAPARATKAASPLLFGLLMDQMGIGVLAISPGLSLSAFVALLMLKARPAARAGAGIAMALLPGTRG